MTPRTCAYCDNFFQPIRQNQKYCSPSCNVQGNFHGRDYVRPDDIKTGNGITVEEKAARGLSAPTMKRVKI